MPDGTLPRPGGWNRFLVEVPDLEDMVRELEAAGVPMRSGIITGVGGRQVLVDDPAGNPVELFEPARSAPDPAASADAGESPGGPRLRPIGRVDSALRDPAEAPKQGGEAAPDAWLVIDRDLHPALRGLAAGADIIVLTWLHRARRDELLTRPRDNPAATELGVFATRAPARPNPIGLHRVTVLDIGDRGIRVRPLEAVDGTPVIDIKPAIGADGP